MTTRSPFSRPLTFFSPLKNFYMAQPEKAPWIIPNLLPPGLTLLTGAPCSGKTSLACQLMLHIALGLDAFKGADNLRASSPGHVLYLGLELSSQRIGELCQRFLAAHPDTVIPPHVSATNTIKPLTPDEGLRELQEEFARHPDLRLLVIDNLDTLRLRFKGNDRKLFALLRSIAEQQNISILLLHTARASSPLVAYADHHLHISRHAVASYYQVDVLGDSTAHASYQLHCPLDGIHFRLATLDECLALDLGGTQKMLTQERVVIIRLFEASNCALTPSQVAAMLKLDRESVKLVMDKMLRANLLCSPSPLHYALNPSLKPILTSLRAQYPIQLDIDMTIIPLPIELKTHTQTAKAAPQSSTSPTSKADAKSAAANIDPGTKTAANRPTPVSEQHQSAPIPDTPTPKLNRAQRRALKFKGKR